MSETKHTPGPWLAVDGILEPDDEGNARSFVRPVHSEGWQVAQTCGPNGSANARLIAAAPDLLDALRELLAHTSFMGIASHYEDMARTAISKAEGSQP